LFFIFTQWIFFVLLQPEYQFFGSCGGTKHDWSKLILAKSVCLEFYIFFRKQNWNIVSLRRERIKKVESVYKLTNTITQKILNVETSGLLLLICYCSRTSCIVFGNDPSRNGRDSFFLHTNCPFKKNQQRKLRKY